jgi:hypothetical protein
VCGSGHSSVAPLCLGDGGVKCLHHFGVGVRVVEPTCVAPDNVLKKDLRGAAVKIVVATIRYTDGVSRTDFISSGPSVLTPLAFVFDQSFGASQNVSHLFRTLITSEVSTPGLLISALRGLSPFRVVQCGHHISLAMGWLGGGSEFAVEVINELGVGAFTANVVESFTDRELEADAVAGCDLGGPFNDPAAEFLLLGHRLGLPCS